MSQRQSVDISTLTIIKIVLIYLLLAFLSKIGDVLLVIFVSLVLAAAIDPTITRWERKGLPRGAGIAIFFIGVLAFLSLMALLFVPLVTTQFDQFARTFPDLYARGLAYLQAAQSGPAIEGLRKALEGLNSTIVQATRGFFSGLFSFFGGLLATIGVLVLTFYLTMEEKGMKRIAIDLAPARHRPYLTKLFNRIEDRLGSWLRGQLLLGLIIAGLTLAGLLVLKIKFALVLALFAGLTELLPIVGPFIGAIPAVIVALSQDPILAVWVVAMYIIVQQLENHFIVPKVMAHATGLNPAIVIVAVLIGAKVGGLAGIILAVPTMIIVTTFLEDFLEEQKLDDRRLEMDPAAPHPPRP